MTTPFVAVDGEGGDWNGSHEYGCISVGSNTLQTGAPLECADILGFLCAQTDRNGPYQKCHLISFFFDYDVTMMLRRLPTKMLDTILDRPQKKDGSTQLAWYHPNGVPWAFGIDYIPHKRLRIIRTGHHPNGKCIVDIHDTSGFFQTSLIQALRDWEVCSESELEVLQSWKDKRSSFTLPLSDDVIEYNLLENRYLCLLLDRVREALDQCPDGGLHLGTWMGAGSIASALLKKYNAYQWMQGIDEIPRGLKDAISHAYYGGRFEVSKHGPLTDIWEYDIGSAYPAAISELPCLSHGKWLHITNSDEIRRLLASGIRGCVQVWWNTNTNRFGPFPWRDKDGSIHYPNDGRGWYWNSELIEALEIWPSSAFQYVDAWFLLEECICRPFAFVPEWYDERKRVGKTTKGRAIKLGLNSLYGKLAQTVGMAEYRNYIWAGMITSDTRAMLLRALYAADSDAVMMATDGFYSARQLPLANGDGLGSWEEAKYDRLFIAQPGFYWGVKNGSTTIRSRGIGIRALTVCNAYTQAERGFAEHGLATKIDVSIRTGSVPSQFIGLRLARQRNNLARAGTWEPIDRVFSLGDPLALKRTESEQLSFASEGFGYTLSYPYKPMRDRLLEIPVNADGPDGPANLDE